MCAGRFPVGLAVWFVEKWWAGSDYGGDLRRCTDMPRDGHLTGMEEPEPPAEDPCGFVAALR